MRLRTLSGDVGCVRGDFVDPAAFLTKALAGKRESSAKFDTAYGVKPYSAENGQFGPLLTIECRGLEFVGFDMTRVGCTLCSCSFVADRPIARRAHGNARA